MKVKGQLLAVENTARTSYESQKVAQEKLERQKEGSFIRNIVYNLMLTGVPIESEFRKPHRIEISLENQEPKERYKIKSSFAILSFTFKTFAIREAQELLKI